MQWEWLHSHCHVTASVTSLQRSRSHLPMEAIYFTVKFQLPALWLISLEEWGGRKDKPAFLWLNSNASWGNLFNAKQIV